MEIAEIGKNVTKKLGKNALPIGLGVGGLVLVMMLVNGNSSVDRTELVTPTGYTSYPDAVTNANVIIGEVNNNIRAEVDRVIDKIDDTHLTMIERFDNTDSLIADRFDNTDSLIQDGVQSILDNAAENQDSVMGAITDAKGEIVGSIQTSEQTIITSTSEKMDTINNQISNQLSTNLTKMNVVNTMQQSLGNVLGKPVFQNTSNLKSKSVGIDITKYYSKLQKNHKTLKEALDIRGIKSTLAARKKIAAANGIKNYTGTAAQDKKLLSLWKKGKLVKA